MESVHVKQQKKSRDKQKLWPPPFFGGGEGGMGALSLLEAGGTGFQKK